MLLPTWWRESPKRLGPVVVARVLRFLSEELRLQGEDVVEHAVDAPSLEPVIRDHARVLQLVPERRAKVTIDPHLAADLRLLQELEAAVQRQLLGAVGPHVKGAPANSRRSL